MERNDRPGWRPRETVREELDRMDREKAIRGTLRRETAKVRLFQGWSNAAKAVFLEGIWSK